MKRYQTLVIHICLLCCAFLLTGCGGGRELPTTEHVKMLSASHMNWGLVNPDDDYWVSTEWTVYYDGTAEYYDKYHLSGDTEIASWQLSPDELNSLYQTLNAGFLDFDQDFEGQSDGSAWHIASFAADGKVAHEFIGYIEAWIDVEEIAPLQSIIKLLTFDYQMFYEDFSFAEAARDAVLN